MATKRQPALADRRAENSLKPRASQACHSCRSRKVKCDFMRSGTPCHNCMVYDVECVIPESRRNRHDRLQNQIRRDQNTALFSTFALHPTRTSREADKNDSEAGSNTPNTLEVETSPSWPEPRRDNILPIKVPQQRLPHEVVSLSISASGNAAPDGLPAYISPPPRGISHQELQFLTQNGALSIPSQPLRDQLLHCYIFNVYPFLPVICLEDFLKALETTGPDGPRISLILFQAVMFSGITSLPEQFLHQAGFDDRRSAQNYFYNKVKLLYDFEWEADRITLIQVILLHTYWYISERQVKCPWYWLGICLSLATSVGLNEENSYLGQDAKTRSLWRRIWWLCYIRDRITGIGMRRPMRLTDEQINIAMLSPNDFELRPCATNIPGLQKTMAVLTQQSRLAVAKMFMAKVTLVSIVGRALNKMYMLQAFDSPSNGPRVFYIPKNQGIDPVEARHLADDLQQWHDQLPEECRVQRNHGEVETIDEFLDLHQMYLKLAFLVAAEALHRPIHLCRGQSTLAMAALQSKSQPLLKECAMNMAELLQQLRERDLLHRLPPLTVTSFGAAIAAFLGELKASGKSLVELPRQCYHCIRGLWSLRDVWPISDEGCQVVGHMIRATQDGSAWTLMMKAKPLRQPATSENPLRGHEREPPKATTEEDVGGGEAGGSSTSLPPMPFTTNPPIMPMPALDTGPLDIGMELGFWWGEGELMATELGELNHTFQESMDHYSDGEVGQLGNGCDYHGGLHASNTGLPAFGGLQPQAGPTTESEWAFPGLAHNNDSSFQLLM